MSCTKCGTIKPGCGCTDNPLTTHYLCNPVSDCLNPETCAQIWSAHCVVWTGPEIVDLNIKPGDRMDQVIQKLILNGLNPGCINPTSSCQSVLDLAPTVINSTSITLAWSPSATAVTYQVEFKTVAAMSWSLMPAIPVGVNTDTIGVLLPNTEYLIRVNAQCGMGSCYSLTIKVKTKP